MKLKSFSEPNEQRKLPFWGLHLQWGSISTSMHVLKVQEPRCHSIPYNANLCKFHSSCVTRAGYAALKEKSSFRMLGYVGWMPSKHLIDSWFSWKRARQVLSSSCAASTASISDEKNIPNIPVHWDPSMPWSPGVLKCQQPPKKKRFFASSPCHQYPLSIHHWTCTYPSLTPMAPAFLGGSFEVVFIWDLFLNPQRIRRFRKGASFRDSATASYQAFKLRPSLMVPSPMSHSTRIRIPHEKVVLRRWTPSFKEIS